MTENAFFRETDEQVNELAGWPIPVEWWSRPYEYAWALNYASDGMLVADMGCGWMQRPFKNGLAAKGAQVLAVDANAKLLEQAPHENIKFIVADFTKGVDSIPDASLDRVFCVSVLEDVGDMTDAALREFARVLKPDGLIVMTFDVHYDLNRQLGQYPGVNLKRLADALEANNLSFREEPDWSKEQAVYHYNFNLTPFHCVLVKA
jgi:ubiquinone/menaquinone biosynthesis C-methylase UbiE